MDGGIADVGSLGVPLAQMRLRSGFPLQVLARSSLRALRFNPAREMRHPYSYVMTFLETVDWKLWVAVGSLSIAALTLFYNYRRHKRTDIQRRGSFEVYVIDSYRVRPSETEGKRILMVNASITNRATRSMSYSCSVSIEYLTGEGVVHRAILGHEPTLVNGVRNDSLTVFEDIVRIDAEAIATGWLLFPVPTSVMEAMRIERYVVVVQDIDGRRNESSIYLIKDITHDSQRP